MKIFLETITFLFYLSVAVETYYSIKYISPFHGGYLIKECQAKHPNQQCEIIAVEKDETKIIQEK